MKLSPPLVGGFKPVRLEQVIKKGEEHWVVVGQHKQVDSQQVGASLHTYDLQTRVMSTII